MAAEILAPEAQNGFLDLHSITGASVHIILTSKINRVAKGLLSPPKKIMCILDPEAVELPKVATK